MSKKELQIALLGNPNAGKSTLFNQLTGLRQKTGNFPGVTVERKAGKMALADGSEANLIDLPGTYSLHPTSKDERIVCSILANPKDADFPDLILYVADATNLEKHFLLLSQVVDLGFPVVLAVSMTDLAEKSGISIQFDKLSQAVGGLPIFPVNARSGEKIEPLRAELFRLLKKIEAEKQAKSTDFRFYELSKKEAEVAAAAQQNLAETSPQRALLAVHHHDWLPFLTENERNSLRAIAETKHFQPLRTQIDETLARFDRFAPIVQSVVKKNLSPAELTPTDRADAVLTHRFWGLLCFFASMMVVFQAIYSWAEWPMTWIEDGFGAFSRLLKANLPESWATDLLTDGLLAGLGGIVVFVPQIAILFFLISLLEEMGYMARAVFLFDKIMQRFGLSGRSIVALISGGACAVPAIMSARTIGSAKERLITILVTPFIPCSARLPVYALLIGLAVPKFMVFGLFSSQALVFMGLYLLGIGMALAASFVLHRLIDTRERSFLMVEMPVYRWPHLKSVALTVFEKTRSFVVEAGKVILLISLVLWVLSSFGPSQKMAQAEREALVLAEKDSLSAVEKDDLVANRKLEASWAGHLGKAIEPAIRPLGYDWKIGIALITSFAAREVFVGTMATLYSVGSAGEDDGPLRQKMAEARFSDTQKPVYTLAAALSLLVFYTLAMQCMSTLAIVRRETGTWRWPILQFVAMSALAYAGAFLTFWLFSK